MERLTGRDLQKGKSGRALRRKVVSLPELMKAIVRNERLKEEDLRSGDRRGEVVKGRRVFCQLVVRWMGHSGAEVLGI